MSDHTSSNSSEHSFMPDDNSNMKRAAAKKLIERYYYQLTDGCGDSACSNVHCASSGKVPRLTPDSAAAKALLMFMSKAHLCESNPSKVRCAGEPCSSISMADGACSLMQTSSTDTDLSNNSLKIVLPATEKTENKAVKYLTESMLLDIIEECKRKQSYSLLVRTIGEVFSRADCLNASFLADKATENENALLKEELREIEGEKDKDEDSMDISVGNEASSKQAIRLRSDEVSVDLKSLRCSYQHLFNIEDMPFLSALINALLIACETAELDLKYHNSFEKDPNYLNMFIIISELPCLQNPEFQDFTLPAFCKAVSLLPIAAQAKFARIIAKNWSARQIKSFVDCLHQLITVKIYTQQFDRDYCINDEESITSATKVLRILFYASIFGGEMDKESTILEETETSDPTGDIFQGAARESKDPSDKSKSIFKDPLSIELNVQPIDCRKPMIDFNEFYHEPLSDQLEMDRDFAYFKTESDNKNGTSGLNNRFSFMNYPFILTPATKALGLYYDNRTRMYSERRMSMIQSIVRGGPSSPFLKLKVRRDHIIDDALVELELIAMENPSDLKKQLVVEFEGEQGIDEGGVSKEFFQLVVEEVFNPDFGMFTLNSETQLYWFNPTSFESDAQFTLIGIVLGLAIYNNVILDVHFPMVVYQKLLGKKGTFNDLTEINPSLYSGLKGLLDYEGDDMEDTFMQNFQVGHQDVFGTYSTHDLKDNGSELLVNQFNKHEFIDLYADFLLNKFIAKQFKAFRKGFAMVTEESPIKMLFRPEEVELLVCGSKNFNFSALEEATDYDGGYTADTPIIKSFWQIVHDFNEEQKRKLLQFCTGSDRVPVGGLSKLKLIIARHGPDSNRLPTAHTCFNVLLLPEYDSQEKLSNALLKAIMYSKGFGML